MRPCVWEADLLGLQQAHELCIARRSCDFYFAFDQCAIRHVVWRAHPELETAVFNCWTKTRILQGPR